MFFGYGSAGNWPGQKPQNPPLPGGGTAIYNSSGLNFIRHTDWLGSSRLATTWAAHAVYSKEAYAPFGETYNEAGTADRSFTGQDQDVVTGSLGTGVYDYLFRKHDPSAGRWLSPDPYGWNAVDITNPQTLNRYAYVANMTMNITDPLGLSDGSYSACTSMFDQDGNPIPTIGSGGQIVYENSPSGVPCSPPPSGCEYVMNAEGNAYEGMSCQGSFMPAPINLGPFGSPGGGAGGSAPNNATPWYQSCTAKALGAGALHVGIDAIGLIPEAGGISRMIGHQAGYVGVVADQVGYRVVNAFGKSTGTVSSLAGLSGESVAEGVWDTSLTVAGFIPALNDVAAVLSIGTDIVKTAVAVGKCP